MNNNSQMNYNATNNKSSSANKFNLKSSTQETINRLTQIKNPIKISPKFESEETFGVFSKKPDEVK